MKKILVIRFSSIGDIVLTTPIIRCIKQQIPEVQLHYLTKIQFKSLLVSNPYIDRIHCLDETGLKVLTRVLKKENYDFIIDLHKNLRSLYVKTKLGSKSSSFPKLNIKKWMVVNLKINCLPDIHIVERYFKAARPMKIQNDNRGLEYYLSENDRVDLESFPEPFSKGYVAVSIGGRHFTKILPAEKIIAAARNFKLPLMLLGGKEDFERGEVIRKALDGRVFNACGQYNINQSASLIEQASRVITNDTGLMHIAAAFGKDILSVWGNTIPEFGMYPYLPRNNKEQSVILQVHGLPCRPCSKLGYNKCPKGHFKCMMEINEEEMVKFANG